MKKLFIACALLIVAVAFVASCSRDEPQVAGNRQPGASAASQPPPQRVHTPHEYAAKGRIPAHYTKAPDVATLPPTLSPQAFTGNIRLAYQAAKEIPQTLAQLPCYCHCDRGHNHKSLLSCFETEHGENCGICIGEALMAYNLQKQDVPIGEIRNKIIAAYGQN